MVQSTESKPHFKTKRSPTRGEGAIWDPPPRFGIYKYKPGFFLFVPSEDMRLVHEASRPGAIIDRAKLPKSTWKEWRQKYKEKPLVLACLYGDSIPKNETLEFNKSMLAFRAEATLARIAAGAIRPPKEDIGPGRHYDQHVSGTLIEFWLKKYPEHGWLERYLLRGEDPPSNVTVPSAQQVAKCRAAFDYIAHCHNAGLRPYTSYNRWIRQRRFPDVRWLRFLFGAGQPEEAYVVPESMANLRSATAPLNIVRKLKMSHQNLKSWKNLKGAAAAFRDAKNLGLRNGEPNWSKNALKLSPRTRKLILRYAKATSLTSRCARATTRESEYLAQLAEAERKGVRKELEDYVNLKGRFPSRKAKCGLAARNFFILSPEMRKFREEAGRVVAALGVWDLRRALPGFDHWFRDWTMPLQKLDKRVVLPFVGEESKESPESNGKTNGQTGHMHVDTLVANKIITPHARRRRRTARKKQGPESMPAPPPICPPPPPEDPGNNPPARLMSVSDLARALGVPAYKVKYFLDDFWKAHRDCREEFNNPRRNAPRFHFVTDIVWQPLRRHFGFT